MVHQLVRVVLRDTALDQDEQVGRLDARLEEGLAFGEIGDVDAVANDLLLRGIEAIEGRVREIEGVGYAIGLGGIEASHR